MTSMKRWVFGSLAVLLAIGMLVTAGMYQPAWANSELHFGARVFFPLWDVRGNRQTYIVLTREALTDGNTIVSVSSKGTIGIEPSANTLYREFFPLDNCRPRGPGGADFITGNNNWNNRFPPSGFGSGGFGNNWNINRTDLSPAGTGANPVFVDDVHLEYYGKSCANQDERIHMSCADVDLFLLDDKNPRPAFSSVQFDQVGAVEAHYVINGSLNFHARKDENSLMGTAIIADVAEGWAAEYPGAAAKSTSCLVCNLLDGGTTVGYEPYPMEVYIPMAWAEGTFGGKLSNLLALWSPNLLPGGALPAGNYAQLLIKWWDGRERPVDTSTSFHALLRTLGDPIQSSQDIPSSVFPLFNVANYTCDQAGVGNSAAFENDGHPRNPAAGGGDSCTTLDVDDPLHKSDNYEVGSSVQSSSPISWWRFELIRDQDTPAILKQAAPLNFDHSGRGLVGVVLTSSPGASFTGFGDALRLWHKDPCNLAQSGENFGPPHVRDASAVLIDAAANLVAGPIAKRGVGGSAITVFNAFDLDTQFEYCDLAHQFVEAAGNIEIPGFTPFVTGLGLK